VTAIISRPVLDPLSPINATLAALRRRHGEDSLQGLAPGLRAPAGWRSAEHLLTHDGVGDFLATAARRWKAQPHAAAALAWKCYSYWLALPAVVGYAATRRVPLMTPAHVRVHYSPTQPFVRLGISEPLAFGPASPETLRTSLLDAHLLPMLERIQEHVHIGRRTMLGSVASGVAYALSRAGYGFEAPTVLAELGVDDLVELTPQPDGQLRIQRKTCCLAFTLPTPKVCSGCCIRTAE
jgi:ferric iron reductase protein FhuF